MELSVILAMLAVAAVLILAVGQGPAEAETLYNGIELPSPWPPEGLKLTQEPPATPPYLVSPPAVIPIDVGRQLLVDDFLVESTTLTRTHHTATYYPGNPILKPDKPWEQEGGYPTAMPFSDGVWWDPAEGLFKAWYMGGYVKGTCYATSRDGTHWDKPELDVVQGTNIVHTKTRDSSTVWLDLEASDPQRRYVLCIYPHPVDGGALETYFSPDGIHWSERAVRTGQTGDRSTIFLNPFRSVWVYGIRWYNDAMGRFRLYRESRDLIEGSRWDAGKPTEWVGADRLDPVREDLKTRCELYNFDCVAYESLMLGLFDIWRGQPEDRAKPNELCVGYSRDGFHWTRPMREPFIPVSEQYGDWNWGNVQSAGGCCLVVGDELWFYVSGRSGDKGNKGSGNSCMGLATLRRDGFASLDAGPEEGTLTTRPLRFTGKRLFVNVSAPRGELAVEVLDAEGHAIAPFTRQTCVPLSLDSTRAEVRWQGAEDLAAIAGQPVRLRFHLRQGSLYSFWVSPDASGASYGYVAAGGPGFTGPRDTVGSAAANR